MPRIWLYKGMDSYYYVRVLHKLLLNAFNIRFLFCYLFYTNFQRKGVVAKMTAGEVLAAEKYRDYQIITVLDNATSACLAVQIRVYQLLLR